MPQDPEESFKGDILIYVDGFRVNDWRCSEHNHPEDIFPFPEASGWAVGDNPRDRYCSRLSTDKLRRFTDYDEAVRYVFEKQRKRKNERSQLRAEFDKDLPGLDALQKVTGRHTAFAASELLKKIQDQGIEAAKASLKISSYYRLVKALRAAGLLEN